VESGTTGSVEEPMTSIKLGPEGSSGDMETVTEKTSMSLALVLLLVGMVGGWAVSGITSFGDVQSRVAVIESKQAATDAQLWRIESKLDRVLGLTK
jgi:hypothetical protein